MARTTPQPPTGSSGSLAAHDFKGLADWIEVFKAGTHVDSKGTQCTFTTADLDAMVANTALGKPPAVLGHPQHDAPAYAWADLKRDGESLFAKFTDVHPAFEAGVQSGAYRNRSLSVLNDKQHGWRVRHVGWLGAAPPAIDGLKPVEFAAADDAEAHEFDACCGGPDPDDLAVAWAFADVARLLRGLREWVIADKGLDVADRVLPDYTVAAIASTAEQLRTAALAETAANPVYTAPAGDPNVNFTAEDLARTAAEAEAKGRTEAAAQFAAQAEELKQLKADQQRIRISTAITGWKAGAKLLPAEEPGMAEFMAALEDAAPQQFEFTAPGAAAPAKQTPSEWFHAFMSARPPVIKLGRDGRVDQTAPEVDLTNGNAIAQAAQKFMADEASAGRQITISQAIAHVSASH